MAGITSIYAGLIAILYFALTWRVISYRRANLISLGDSGDKNLLKRMRTQANCAETAPIGLILILLVELQGAPAVAVHGLGVLLLAGRVLHPLGFAVTPQKIILRQVGMLLTFACWLLGALALLAHALI